ncbi:MAG: hypothetical protein JWP01_276 [Myxococcales bacterium]|nr:hypothetical protein [Myxococcales bacterium]
MALEAVPRMLLRLVSLSLLVLGCARPDTGGGDDTSGGDAGPGSLRVGLSAQRIDWADGVAPAPGVTVTLIAADGTETDVTAAATFEVMPASLGSVTSAQLVASGSAAGPGVLSAVVDGLADTETFEVFMTQTVTDGDRKGAVVHGRVAPPVRRALTRCPATAAVARAVLSRARPRGAAGDRTCCAVAVPAADGRQSHRAMDRGDRSHSVSVSAGVS